MNDKVRTQDYQKYLELGLEKVSKKSQDARQKYAECKKEYEEKFLPKLFGWKFENSWQGDTSYMGSWNFYTQTIRDFNAEINRCIYQTKIQNEHIAIGEWFCADSFYRWCRENSIPY